MSNANKTARTTFVGVRIPNDLLSVVDGVAESRSSAIVTALRAYYLPASDQLDAPRVRPGEEVA